MNDLTNPPQPPKLSAAYSATAELTVELAKILTLVAPASMSTEQQELWLRAAVSALEDIRPAEVRSISAELCRSVTRHNQIVPEIARLVSERRKRAAAPLRAEGLMSEWAINREAQERRNKAKTQAEIEASYDWEQNMRRANGLRPHQPPLSRNELDNMLPHVRDLGLARGLLEYRDGQLIEVRL